MDHDTQNSTNASDTDTQKPEVYYDGSCPLCRAEINLYQSSGAEARFCDISQGHDIPDGHSHTAMMARFHIRDEHGQLRSGAAAFAALWRATPGWRSLGHVVGTPPFVWIAEGLYRVFLIIRPVIQALFRRFSKA